MVVKNNQFKPTLKQRIIYSGIKTSLVLAFLSPFAIVGGFLYAALHFIYKLW